MDRAYLRVGSERYADRAEAPSFGAATLRKEHVRVRGDTVTLTFPGKSGVRWERSLHDPLLARALSEFIALPGDRLFQVRGEGGALRPITADHVRRALTPYGALPKDFRTLHANRLFTAELAELGPASDPRRAEKNIRRAIERAARELNHTPQVFESSYLDPALKEVYRKTGRAGRGPP
jgi:DNA topoisomerase I